MTLDDPEAGNALPMLHRQRLRVLQPGFEHDDDDVGAETGQLTPAHGRRAEAGVPGDVLAARDRDHLRNPESAHARWVEPTQGDFNAAMRRHFETEVRMFLSSVLLGAAP